ncbi:hypothetical protein LTR85_007770 [Meristemomyces frigidus]|nr:hypothetical protein LTR85_007770 [Meristemomyces frigidus]
MKNKIERDTHMSPSAAKRDEAKRERDNTPTYLPGRYRADDEMPKSFDHMSFDGDTAKRRGADAFQDAVKEHSRTACTNIEYHDIPCHGIDRRSVESIKRSIIENRPNSTTQALRHADVPSRSRPSNAMDMPPTVDADKRKHSVLRTHTPPTRFYEDSENSYPPSDSSSVVVGDDLPMRIYSGAEWGFPTDDVKDSIPSHNYGHGPLQRKPQSPIRHTTLHEDVHAFGECSYFDCASNRAGLSTLQSINREAMTATDKLRGTYTRDMAGIKHIYMEASFLSLYNAAVITAFLLYMSGAQVALPLSIQLRQEFSLACVYFGGKWNNREFKKAAADELRVTMAFAAVEDLRGVACDIASTYHWDSSKAWRNVRHALIKAAATRGEEMLADSECRKTLSSYTYQPMTELVEAMGERDKRSAS